jgi:hypothetical protein
MTMMAGVLVALMAAETAPDGPTPAATPAPQQVERGDLVTDRPDFTESSLVVGAGIWQLETGMAFEGDAAGARAFAAPQALLRLGLSRRVELRLGAGGFLAERSATGIESTTGGSDFEIGAKVTVLDEERHGIGVSLIPIVSLPVGSDAFSSGGVDPTLKITWARELPRGFGLSGNVNVMAETEEDEHVGRHAWSFSLGHELVYGWGGYAEVYGFSSLERGGDAAWTVNGGLTRGIGGDRQFDVSVGRGVTDAAPNWFVSAGFSLRGAWRR